MKKNVKKCKQFGILLRIKKVSAVWHFIVNEKGAKVSKLKKCIKSNPAQELLRLGLLHYLRSNIFFIPSVLSFTFNL